MRIRVLLEGAADGVASSIKWGQPVFEVAGPVAWMRAHGGHVNVGFWRGAQLDDPKRLLQGSGAKMRHLKLYPGDEVPEEDLRRFMLEAVELNRKLGSPAR